MFDKLLNCCVLVASLLIKQKMDEFNALLALITNKTSILEIGTFDGETAILFSDNGRRKVVTVDPYANPALPDDIILVHGFSQNEKTIEQVSQYAPFDFIFIDGDHRRADLDFQIYEQFLAPGGMVAFHDINPNANFATYPVVPVWEELKKKYRNFEIISDIDNRTGYGIGVIFP